MVTMLAYLPGGVISMRYSPMRKLPEIPYPHRLRTHFGRCICFAVFGWAVAFGANMFFVFGFVVFVVFRFSLFLSFLCYFCYFASFLPLTLLVCNFIQWD